MTPITSVVICTHNPREDYLSRVISALRQQTLARERWELVVVDNVSTSPVADRFDFSWHSGARAIREDKLGLTPARLRGIREARGELLVFVDDDNVLDLDYLEKATEIAAGYPHLAAWSGNCRGEFEVQPEEWAKKYLGPLCVYEFDRDYWSNFPFQNMAMPSGAGLCLRKEAARQYVELHYRGLRPMVLDRTGTSLLSGGDIDIALTCARNGYGTGVFTRLRLTHLMPKIRVQKCYLLNLTEALGFTGEIIEFYHPSPPIPCGSRLRKRIANALRAMLMSPLDREFFRARQRGRLAGQKAVEQLRRHDQLDSAPLGAMRKG
jgi:glycosyltransferase involved in cell wall biosynthesis